MGIITKKMNLNTEIKKIYKAMGYKPIVVTLLIQNNNVFVVSVQNKRFVDLPDNEPDEESAFKRNFSK